MKRFVLICFIAATLPAKAQEAISYIDLLAKASEINISDSLVFDTEPGAYTPIDSLTMKKWFPQLLSSGANKFKNKTYSIFGKITYNENFDLLLILEEKRKNDSTGIRISYLISVKKTGEYIQSIKAAVNGTKKKTDYNISSCMYKGNKIVQDSRISTEALVYDDMTNYRINAGGRFIMLIN